MCDPYFPILGFDIGGTKTAVVLGDDQGQVTARREFATPVDRDFSPALEILTEYAQGLMKQTGGASPAAISVSVGGPLDITRGILFSPPHLAAWGTAPLKTALEANFNLPVYVEHDGNAGALAEFYFGAGRGAHTMVFLTMGTGVGAGIIINGEIFHGVTDTAGEVGHVRLAPDGPVEYGKAGAWESFCSGSGMAKLARARYPEVFGPALTTHQFVTQALAGQPEAAAVVQEAGRWLGQGLALLIDILNPDTIVLGTLGVVLGDLLLDPARQVIQEEALPIPAAACRIVPAQLGKSLGDIASLCAAIQARRKGAA